MVVKIQPKIYIIHLSNWEIYLMAHQPKTTCREPVNHASQAPNLEQGTFWN